MELVLTHLQRDARWRLPISLTSMTPSPDDVIIIQGMAKQRSSVSFNIVNPYEDPLPFRAHFVRGVTAELDVTPQNGMLQPSVDGENIVQVDYRPATNGKTCVSLLIIEVLDT